MITSSQIYWITRLDHLSELFGVGGFLVAAAGAILCFCINEIKIFPAKFIGPIMVMFGIMMMVTNTFLPTQKKAIAIYCLPSIVNNQTVQEIPANTATFINEQLKAWIEEVKK